MLQLNMVFFAGPDAVKYIVNHAVVQVIYCVPETLNSVSLSYSLFRVLYNLMISFWLLLSFVLSFVYVEYSMTTDNYFKFLEMHLGSAM